MIYIKRDIFDEIYAHIHEPEITLLTGPRQVGKTTLLQELKRTLQEKEHTPSDAILTFNLDLVNDEEKFQNQSEFIRFLSERSKDKKLYVFVDEAQKVPEAARFFKGVYDSHLNIKLILTGSSSLELKAKLKETLSGRKRIFPIPPFSFEEFLLAKDPTLSKLLNTTDQLSEISSGELLRHYKEYIVFGGYPRIVLAEDTPSKTALLQEIYSSYVERDIVGLLSIKNKATFQRLLKLLAHQSGQLVNIAELSTILETNGNTLRRYIHALEETFILKTLTPYFRNKRQEIVKAGKIYFNDSGIRNFILGNFDPFDQHLDKGQLLENMVFQELLALCQKSFAKLHFWRTKQKAEVDFVIDKGITLIPVEVKTTMPDTKIPKNLLHFMEKFSVTNALLISLSHRHPVVIEHKGLKVFFALPYEISQVIHRLLR